MSQAYVARRQPATQQSPAKETLTTNFQREDKPLGDEDIQGAYLDHKDRLLNAIDTTKIILNDLREFNKDTWVVRYPQLSSSNGSPRRSLSFVDNPASTTDVILKPGMQHSVTLASVPHDEQKATEITDQHLSSDFRVLRLDLKLGPHASSTGPAFLVSQLEKSSIANLLDERIAASVNHVDKLRLRIEDTSSKVLVTGDLNAGKSTFVNALLRRPVMPVDQQPCTTMFCEVHDAAENNGLEEVHIAREGTVYDIKDQATYTRASLSELETIVGQNENVQQMVRLYVADARQPSESLLHNGVVDIALIDAPGLNRDSFKTTALFARQEEIDVVVFVVSAENHFTLSAKEFLWNASNEKAYLFIVVNRFDQIRDKEKCKRLVLEQIKQLSPRTYEDAETLVHFVDSSSSQQPTSANATFGDLETSLRSFVLVKRAKSKLHPASTYLCHLLSDVDLLASSNAIVARTELDQARDDLSRARPILEKMKHGREHLEESLESVEENGSAKAGSRTKSVLSSALERVGNGEPGVDKGITMPTYPGLLGIWGYTRDVRRTLLASLDMAVRLAQDEARVTTSSAIDHIATLGEKHLPEGVERSKRVFMPERMFSPKKGCRSSVVAGGTHGLGLGLAQRPELLEITFFDVFDVRHHFSVHFGDGSDAKSAEEEDSQVTALSVVSVGVGALTMVGGKTLGARGIIEGIVRITDLLGNETVRKWAAPVIGAFTIGLTAYFILELPNSIPRTVGRRIRTSLIHPAEGDSEDTTYVNAHATRVSRETRKVLRLASWDLRERFRAAMEERGREVKGAEEVERKAAIALEWFTDVGKRAANARSTAGLV
ncbi:transmembrane GTPase fzo1 [Gautieria morchelliformis]|nr:transmembrane GTPase fzo1 [Gautieria morchelliformis]